MNTKLIVTAIFAILLAFYYPNLKQTIVWFGFFNELNSNVAGICRVIPGPEACEDIEIHHPSGLAFLACSSAASRHILLEGYDSEHVPKDYVPRDTPYIYNIGKDILSPVALSNFPETIDFCLHGLGLIEDPADPKQVYLFFVNHRRTGDVIEIFKNTIGSLELVHVNTIGDPLFRSLNDVVPISPTEFYATNDHFYKHGGLVTKFEEYTFRKWGSVVFHSTKKNETRVAVDEIFFPNGLSRNWDGSKIYLATSGGYLCMYDHHSDHRLSLSQQIYFEIPLDNVHVDEFTGEIYAAGFQNLHKYLSLVKDPNYKSPRTASVIFKISNNTSQDRYYGQAYSIERVVEDDGTTFYSVSTGAIDGTRKILLIGTIFMNGIGRCELA